MMIESNFNSRPCARGDGFITALTGAIILFQFPPLREGRLVQGMHEDFVANFNSRPCARGDLVEREKDGWSLVFQFPPLREGRHVPVPALWAIYYFNSRPCARGDIMLMPDYGNVMISIPAPARGATTAMQNKISKPFISIPAPARGAT